MKFLNRVRNYIRYDLKEILNPSSLPDPPGTPPRRKLTLKEWISLFRETYLDYIDSWRSEPCRPVHLDSESDPKPNKAEAEELNILQELVKVLKEGKRDIRPGLQKLYYSRGKVLSRTVRSFAEGFNEGLAEMRTQKDDVTKHK